MTKQLAGKGTRSVPRRVIKESLRQLAHPLRRATRSFRRHPDTLVIGAARSGTTMLHHCLTQHPGIAGGVWQETHFFDRHFAKGIGWYRSQFPIRAPGRVLDVTHASRVSIASARSCRTLA